MTELLKMPLTRVECFRRSKAEIDRVLKSASRPMGFSWLRLAWQYAQGYRTDFRNRLCTNNLLPSSHRRTEWLGIAFLGMYPELTEFVLWLTRRRNAISALKHQPVTCC